MQPTRPVGLLLALSVSWVGAARGCLFEPVGASLTVVGLRNATVPLPPPRPTTHYPQPAQPHYFLPANAAHSSATCSNLFQSWRTGGSGVGGGQVESLVAGALLCWLLLLVDRA